MSPELENSHGDVDHKVPYPSSHQRWGACGKAGEMGGGTDSLPFSQDQTGVPL